MDFLLASNIIIARASPEIIREFAERFASLISVCLPSIQAPGSVGCPFSPVNPAEWLDP
jgi:hypothetical protein